MEEEARLIYTAGYGNRTPKEWQQLLVDAGIDIAVDVRRQGTGARISSYTPANMGKTLSQLSYYHAHRLGNYYETLDGYKEFLKTPFWQTDREIIKIAEDVVAGVSVCIICSERHAYKDHSVNCHRVYVAEAVVAAVSETGEMLAIRHL